MSENVYRKVLLETKIDTLERVQAFIADDIETLKKMLAETT